MTAIRVAALLVFTFGVFAYGAVLVFWGREAGRMPWGAVRRETTARPADRVGTAMVVVSFVWFVVNLLLTLARLGLMNGEPLDFAVLWLALAFPPLIMHVAVSEATRATGRPLPSQWQRAPWPVYAVSAGTAIVATLVLADLVHWISAASMAWVLNLVLGVAFIAAAIFSATLISRRDNRKTERERQSHRWMVALFGFMALLFVITFAEGRVPELVRAVLELTARSLPLLFMFVGSYWEDRFGFFDLFVKRGVALIATILILAAAFALVVPWLERVSGSPAAPWIYAVVMLPAVGALPWVHGRIGAALDRWWLGRRFAPVEAVKHFVSGLRSATTERQLLAKAEAELSEIFGAPAAVRLDAGDGAPPPFNVVHTARVRSGDAIIGRLMLGKRASEAPYFSEDLALLSTLADVFGSVAQNMELQRREQEQDRRARELSLHASRSELKALRAQINPHFLFNALNAIAGLIHRNPAVADDTVEKLADVFRYALRGAESEWAVLDSELEFVRAYLDVERARFGERLQVDVDADAEVRGARVPTMIVQTLVENAVKHGVLHQRLDDHRRHPRAADLRVGVDVDLQAFPEPGTLHIEIRAHEL
ncbi:MAG TPA: histidine kinase, partial [Vicinamibacterales bacterium]|nr:histidine kinase [Vicinamibacterales bacterium]